MPRAASAKLFTGAKEVLGKSGTGILPVIPLPEPQAGGSAITRVTRESVCGYRKKKGLTLFPDVYIVIT